MKKNQKKIREIAFLAVLKHDFWAFWPYLKLQKNVIWS